MVRRSKPSTAVHEWLAQRREAQVDAALAAGYATEPVGTEVNVWADLSVEGMTAGNLTGRRPRGEVWPAAMDRLRPAVVITATSPDASSRRASGTVDHHHPRHPHRGSSRFEDGIDRDCVAALDNLTLLRKDRLVRRLGLLTPERMDDLCDADMTGSADY